MEPEPWESGIDDGRSDPPERTADASVPAETWESDSPDRKGRDSSDGTLGYQIQDGSSGDGAEKSTESVFDGPDVDGFFSSPSVEDAPSQSSAVGGGPPGYETFFLEALRRFGAARRVDGTYASNRVLTIVVIGDRGDGNLVGKLEPKLNYFDRRSGLSAIFFAVGFGGPNAKYIGADALQPVDYFESITTWKWLGNTDFLIFDTILDPLHPDLSQCILLTVEKELDGKTILSINELMEVLIAFAKQDHERPTWAFSDEMAVKFAKGAGWATLLNLIPESLRDAADRAKSYAVQNLSKR